MAWNTNGILNAPSAGDIVADTGGLIAGTPNFNLVCWTNSAGTIVEVALRNALNTSDVAVQRMHIESGGPRQIPFPINVMLNQRLVVRMLNGINDDVQISIIN